MASFRHDLDPAALYSGERRRFAAWLIARPTSDLDVPVPATPAWRVVDVVAHLVGITADLNAGRFGDQGRGGDDWTAEQVAVRRGRALAELCDEWDLEGGRFEEGLRLFGYEFGAHYVHDLAQHVADVAAALGLDPRRDDAVTITALDFALSALDADLRERGRPAIRIVVPDEAWVVGSGAPTATLTASRWEVLRSVGGRRTVAEMATLAWTGDAGAVIPDLSRYPTPLRSIREPSAGTAS